MSIVVFADGVVAVENRVEPGSPESLYERHAVDRDLADDSVIEEALRLKKQMTGSTVTLVSAAPAAFEKHMRAYLAAGCDRALRVEANYAAMLDVRLHAKVLLAVLEKIGDWKVALFLDRTGAGAPALIPHYVSQLAGAPSLAQVVSAQPEGEGVKVVRRIAGTVYTYQAARPIVLAVSSRAALRNPSFMDVHRSRKATIEIVNAVEVPSYANHADDWAIPQLQQLRAPEQEQRKAAAVTQLPLEETVERIAALCSPFLTPASS
jgi:electron transfer flavoprotein alpha/beta subunit